MTYYLTQEGREFLEEAGFVKKAVNKTLKGAKLAGKVGVELIKFLGQGPADTGDDFPPSAGIGNDQAADRTRELFKNKK